MTWSIVEQLQALGQCLPLPAVLLLCALSAVVVLLLLRHPYKQRLYLLDFVAQKPDESWCSSRDRLTDSAERSEFFPKEAMQFQLKVLYASGLGNATHAPDWLHSFPQDTSIAKARLEFELVALRAASELFARTGVSPAEVGVVVVNSSVFCPTPSLAAMVMHHFKMGHRTMHYNLGGMGCAASPVAIDVAQQALLARPNSYALVISTEVITQSVYKGTQRSMLVPNVLFRSGGAAILLTNKPSEARRAKYQLHCLVRTNMVADDDAYGAAQEMEDSEGLKGIKLSRELPRIAAKALRLNLIELLPKIMPLAEKVAFARNYVARKVLGYELKPYRASIQRSAQHICIHTGGKAVIDGISRELAMTADYVEPSRAALHRYGNTSCSSIWYVLSYIETFRGLQRGDKVLQLAFGSGFKCNSLVWTANKSFRHNHPTWKGFDLAAMYEDLKSTEIQLKQLLADMAATAAMTTPTDQQVGVRQSAAIMLDAA